MSLPRCGRPLAPLLDLTAAVDDKGHFFAVFRCLDGGAFGSGFDVADLRISSGFKIGYKLMLGQGLGGREGTNQEHRGKNRVKDCAREHDLCSLARRTAKMYAVTSTIIRHSGSAVTGLPCHGLRPARF